MALKAFVHPGYASPPACVPVVEGIILQGNPSASVARLLRRTPEAMRTQVLLLIFLLSCWCVAARAQEDPNGQYLAIFAQSLNDETRDLPVTVEATTLRLFFTVQSESGITWQLLAPTGRVFNLKAGNVQITDSPNKRIVAIWDPRPGEWRVQLKGKGGFTLTAMTQSELYSCCLNLAGRQTPQDRVPLVSGSRQQATVYVSGNSVETVNFHLVNERGEVLAPVQVRQNDYSNPYNFNLYFTMPNEPCRVRVTGRSQHGLPYQRVYAPMLQPSASAPATESAPTVVQMDGPNPLVTGEHKIVRAEVVKYSDEPLLSAQGHPIGVRFKYTMVFPRAGTYMPQPNLYPERINNATFTGALSLRFVRSRVTPLPDNADPTGQVLFNGRASYQRGIPYEFTVDLLPNFAIYREAQKDYCLMTRQYSGPGMKEKFDREIGSDERVRYRITLNGTDLDGRQLTLTANGYTPRLWYQNLLKEGVGECQ
jgi:hypothetical protein